jgi:autotransporter-associated beta strand protein
MNGADNAAQTVNVLQNSTLYVAAGVTKNASIVLNGGSTGEPLGQLRLEANANWAGPVTLSGTMTGGSGYVGANTGTGTISGTISETGGSRTLSKIGAGTIVVTNTANSYTGGTQIISGPLQIGALNVLGAATGTLSFTGPGGLITGTSAGASGTFVYPIAFLASSGTLNTNGNSVTFSGLISGTGNLFKAGSGTATITGSNAFSGNTTVSAGVLSLGNVNALQASILTLSGGTTTFVVPGTNTYNLGGLSGTGNLDMGANSLALLASRASTYSGTLAGTGSLTKSGTAVVTLSASNSYSGGTQLNAGTLTINNLGAIGTGTVTYTGTSTLRTGTSGTIANAFAINSGVTGTFDTQAFANTLSGPISGLGTFAKMGTGTLTLPSSNAYTGGTRLSAGVLAIGDVGALGTGTFTYAGSSTLRTGTSGTIANPFAINTGVTATFDTQGFANTLSGLISGTGTGTLVKTG